MKKFRELSEAVKDKFDIGEYDQEGDMAKSDLRSILANAKRVHDMLEDDDNLPEWVQSKITKAEDYMSTVANYMEAEMNEEVELSEMDKSQPSSSRGAEGLPLGKKAYPVKTDKVKSDALKILQKQYKKVKEEVELDEGRPSQRHPLEGHEYHRKSDAELVGIAKDAHKAAEAMKSHNTTAENKYRDQANDSATVRYFRKKSGMPDWYKKKYGHMKEEVELEEGMKPYVSSVSPKLGEKGSHDVMDKEGKVVKSYPHSKEGMMSAQSHLKKMKEEVEQLDEKNEPTNPELWSRAKALAKSKFDVYPSAYANGWASKWYKSKGGGWKSVNEAKDDLPFKADKPQKMSVVVGKKPAGYSMARHLARQAMQKQIEKMKKPVKEETMSKKAKIVKNAMKKTSKEDEFQAEPMISQSIVKNN